MKVRGEWCTGAHGGVDVPLLVGLAMVLMVGCGIEPAQSPVASGEAGPDWTAGELPDASVIDALGPARDASPAAASQAKRAEERGGQAVEVKPDSSVSRVADSQDECCPEFVARAAPEPGPALGVSLGDRRTVGLVVNEVMASNSGVVTDEDGDSPDWVELYNGGSETVSLAGLYLSDRAEELLRWPLPGGELGSGEALLIWLSGKDRHEEGALHASFALKAGKESIFLADASGAIHDEVPAVEVPTDWSLARLPDGVGAFQPSSAPTPGEPNTVGVSAPGLPAFTPEGGFYEWEVQVTIECPGPNAEARCTVDGSEPHVGSPSCGVGFAVDRTDLLEPVVSLIPTTTPDHSGSWKAPASPPFRGLPVRARCFAPSGEVGPVATHTYFVAPGATDRYPVGVLALSGDPEGLFGYDDGIMVPGALFEAAADPNASWWLQPANYVQSGLQWERRVGVEWFDGPHVARFDAGVRINGASTRHIAQKALRLLTREEYGTKWWKENLFEESEVQKFKRLVLRSGGQDYGWSRLRGALVHRAAVGLGVAVMASRPVVAFVNGEYWGAYLLRERFDARYVQSRTGIPEERVAIAGLEADSADEVEALDILALQSIQWGLIGADLDEPDAMAQLEEQVDLGSYFDYVCTVVWSRKTEIAEYRAWRDREPEDPGGLGPSDGRWRWVLKDLDTAFSPYDPDLDAWEALKSTDPMLVAMLEAPGARQRLLSRCVDLLNGPLRSARAAAVLDDLAAGLAPLMDEHVARWGYPVSTAFWQSEVDALREAVVEREDVAIAELGTKFGLGEPCAVEVRAEPAGAGEVWVNGLAAATLDSPAWAGRFFDGHELELEAIAAPGWQFAGWSQQGAPVDGEPAGVLMVALPTPLAAPWVAHFEPSP